MKLEKQTREKLYKAQGRPVSISWPLEAPEPHAGRRYPVYGEAGEKLFTIRLERSKRSKGRSEETTAWVKIDNDPRRVMPGLAAQRNDLGDYETEPEPVSEEYEDLLAAEALQKTTVLGAEQRQQQRVQGKEQRAGSGTRAERAVTRHRKSIERQMAA